MLNTAEEIPIVAIDTRYWHVGTKIFDAISPHAKIIKLGLGMLHTHGHGTTLFGHTCGRARHAGIKVLVDSKINDVPNTLSDAVNGIEWMGSWGFTYHLRNNPQAIRSIMTSRKNTLSFGVSVLSSMSVRQCRKEFGDSPKNIVARDTRRVVHHGGGAIVSSGHENDIIREQRGGSSLIVANVGVYPDGTPVSPGQKRVVTPTRAIRSGADYLIVGRSVTRAPDPAYAFLKIVEEVAKAKATLSMT